MLDAAPAPPTLRSLLTLAWPIILSRATQVVIGLTDTLLVSHLGAAALAATGVGALNSYVLFILPMGICFVVSSFTSQLFGRGDLAGARRFGWYGLFVAALSQVVAVASLPLVEPALGLLSHDDTTRELMAGYLHVRLLSTGAAVGIEALSNYFGGLGQTRPGMVTAVAAMVLNVLLTWMLIDGNLGAPALGVNGAALATTITTTAAFAGFLLYFLTRPGRQRTPLKVKELVRLFRFGVPEGVNFMMEFLAFVVFINVVVAGLGVTTVAAMNVVFNVNALSFMPSFGLASAGAILVGQAIGRGQQDQVGRVVRLSLLTAMAWQGAVGLMYVLIPSVLIAPFARGDDGPEVLAVGAGMLAIASAWQLFDATATSLAESLRAAGDTLFPALARLIIAWFIFTPGAYFSVRELGWDERGATVWIVLYLALLAGALAYRYRSGAWRSIKLIEPMPVD